jgi:hypothetical protein
MEKDTGKKATGDVSVEGLIIKSALRKADGDIKTAAHSLGMRPREFGRAMSENEIRRVDLRGVSCW